MYINIIDEFFDNILNKFFNFLNKNDIFLKLNTDTNFVKFQKLILDTINTFINPITIEWVKNENNKNYIINIIKRYCAFYIYLGIGYYYKGNKELYITNIIESGKTQKEGIVNFFNSDNNSKIINFYNIIQNIKKLVELKTMDKIKISLSNNPLKFDSTINLFNELGEDYIIEYFLIKENFHNILKTLIFKQIYLKEEKIDINNLINEIEKEDAEYKYIEIVVSNQKKIVDFNIIQKFLTFKQLKLGLAEDIYSYIEEIQLDKEETIKKNYEIINFLFSNKILIPISEDFLRYHKDSEKYETPNSGPKNRESTKIKYIINKINNVKNYYSPIVEKNAKLKLEINELYYKQFAPRQVILYNETEELKIIQKLENKDTVEDFDLLIDLINIRKYAYVNYKFISNYFIKLRTINTINAIRSTNIKQKKNEFLELRIGNDNIDLDVIGIAWNPSILNKLKLLECYKTNDLVNVKNYNSFINILQNIKSNKKLYYWIFNINNKINIKEYVDLNLNEPVKVIKILLVEIYKIYVNLVVSKFEEYILKKKINIWELDYIINKFSIIYDLNPDIKNHFINKILTEKILEPSIIEDEIDNVIPGKGKKIIKLPYVNIKKEIINKITIGTINDSITVNEYIHFAVCNHHQKWENILKNKKNNNFNQIIFDFVKKYVKENDRGEYICKSCDEILDLKKYVPEGFYNKDTNEFMTTSIIVNQKLEDQNKYIIYLRTIKFLGRNIEKIAYIGNILYYLGESPTIKLHKKTSIKDIIDLILIHTTYLKEQPKDRIIQASEKYNINKDLTNLFFFELKDEIFLTSSQSTDYYTIIKYNNVVVYTILIILLELNSGQILNFKDDKRCNYFFYSKFGEPLFTNLYLRLNEKEKILVTKIPLLAYCIFYFSCILTSNKIWLYQSNDTNFNVTIQKTIIHTLIDLINTIMEANMQKDKYYLYELLATKFINKVNNTFNDLLLLKCIEINSNKKIKFDETTKKISIIKKIVPLINIENNNIIINNENKEYCLVSSFKINKKPEIKNNNSLNNLTNCSSGSFHKWYSKNGKLECSICKEIYDDNLTETNNTNYHEKVKLTIIKKLTKKYCISGKFHDINEKTYICNICNINPDTYKYTEKELYQLEKNINNTIYYPPKKENNDDIKKIMKKFNKNYIDINNYIHEFIEKLINIVGDKIKINNSIIYLKDTLYIIKYNYLGILLKEPIYIRSSSDIVKIYEKHSYFKKDVIYYKDKANNVFVYYDIISLQYIGYSEDNKNIKYNNNIASLIIELSIKDSLLYLGLENKYINLYHLDPNYQYNSNIDSCSIINNLIRTRICNLKQLINNTISIIYTIRNHKKYNQYYNVNQKEIVDEFSKKLKQFNIKDKDNHNIIFKNFIIINNNLKMNKFCSTIDIKLINNYFDCSFINNMKNIDLKLIYYLISNFNKLLDYNEQNNIKIEIANMIVKIIQYLHKSYYNPINQCDIRKFDFLLINDISYIDENVRIVGYYNELVSINELDEDKIKEENYNAQEENDALDIDDYKDDENDNEDIDYNIEAIDNN